MRLSYKQAVGGKTGALILVNNEGWAKAAVILANQNNIPGLCVLLHGLNWGIYSERYGLQWQCPSTRELLESTYPDDRDQLADEILEYLQEYYG